VRRHAQDRTSPALVVFYRAHPANANNSQHQRHTQVRSLTLDRHVWSRPLIGILLGMGNAASQRVLERTATESDIATRRRRASARDGGGYQQSSNQSLVDESDEEEQAVEDWILAKYQRRAFLGDPPPNYDAQASLQQAAKDGDLPAILQALCFGASLDTPDHVGRSALMAAAACGHDAAVAMLYFNGASLDVQDGAGDRAEDVAMNEEVCACVHVCCLLVCVCVRLCSCRLLRFWASLLVRLCACTCLGRRMGRQEPVGLHAVRCG
jgi:hypothetical protein